MSSLVVICAAVLVNKCAGHGAVVHPPPRNAADGKLEPWSNGVPYPVTFGGPSCEDNCARKMDVCSKGAKATICDPSLRTYNINATCGGPHDFYYYSPWRAPGSAPVFDSCGVAGGRPPPAGKYGAQFKNTSVAKQGDHGSKTLPSAPSGVTWTAGEAVEVSWALMANHGGGYQYRLCPSSGPLTEECFFKTPLNFVGSQRFRWGGRGGKEMNITGTYVSEGTLPVGSTWAMNPIPDFGSDPDHGPHPGVSFKPRCKEVPNCGSGVPALTSR